MKPLSMYRRGIANFHSTRGLPGTMSAPGDVAASTSFRHMS